MLIALSIFHLSFASSDPCGEVDTEGSSRPVGVGSGGGGSAGAVAEGEVYLLVLHCADDRTADAFRLLREVAISFRIGFGEKKDFVEDIWSIGGEPLKTSLLCGSVDTIAGLLEGGTDCYINDRYQYYSIKTNVLSYHEIIDKQIGILDRLSVEIVGDGVATLIDYRLTDSHSWSFPFSPGHLNVIGATTLLGLDFKLEEGSWTFTPFLMNTSTKIVLKGLTLSLDDTKKYQKSLLHAQLKVAKARASARAGRK